MPEKETTGVRKMREGIVVSDSMDKTIVVRVERLVRHPLYGRVLRRRKKYMVHDENNEAHLGDIVRIAESRPYSRRKSWRMVAIVRRAETPQAGVEAVTEAVEVTDEVADIIAEAEQDVPAAEDVSADEPEAAEHGDFEDDDEGDEDLEDEDED